MASKRRGKRPTNQRRGNRLLGYIRVSAVGGRSGEKFLSPDVQKADQLRWAASHDCVIVDWVTDLDKTGTESSARKIAEAINRIEAGEADGVLVRKVDRWGRNTLDSLLNIGELQSVGGFIASTTEDLENVDTPAGRFSLTVLLAIAEMFSADMAKSWRSIHDLRRELGKASHGGARLGYVRRRDVADDERSYVFPERDGVRSDYAVDPAVAPWIEKAFMDYIAGRSLQGVVEMLNDAGIRSTRGNPLSYQSLKKTMERGFPAGLLWTERSGEVEFLPGLHEPIVERDVFDAFLAKLHSGAAPRNKHATQRLTRLVYCAGCGRRLGLHTYTRNGVTKSTWFCSHSRTGQGYDYCAAPATIYQPLLEQQVYDWLLERSAGQAALDAQVGRARKVVQSEKDVARIDRELQRVRKRLSILADKVLDGEMPGVAAKIKEEELLTEIARLEESRRATAGEGQINALPDLQVFGALIAGWALMDKAILNEGLHKVIGRIEVTKAGARNARAKVNVIGRWELEQVAPAA